MKKKMLKRGLFGFPVGIAVGFVISLFVSARIGDGFFHPVASALTSAMGSELNAVVLQTLLCGVMGAGFATASVIWEMDSWSLARQSGVYFAVICLLMLPAAYLCNWMPHTLGGIVSYVGIFIAIFAFVWIALYLALRGKIKKMNAGVKREEQTK